MTQPSLFSVFIDLDKIKKGTYLTVYDNNKAFKVKLKAYGYELNKQLIEIAYEIMHWCLGKRQYKFLSKEIFEDQHKPLTQFQKLKYFGIIKKCEKSKFWQFTKIGYEFLKGNISLPKKVWVLPENGIIDESDEKIFVDKAEPNFKSYWDWIDDYILISFEKVFCHY